MTRATDRIGLSQPAIGNSVFRLRYIFKDDLLVHTASGMQATPKALELLEPTRQVIRQIECVLQSDTGFDPSQSNRTFTVRLSWEYVTKRGVCLSCRLREFCTRSKTGRSIKRHRDQNLLDRARRQANTKRARLDGNAGSI